MIAFSAVANAGVAFFLRRQARKHDSPALAGDAAHLGTDALTSLGVLVGLVLVRVTGAVAIDSAVAIAVAVVIVFAGVGSCAARLGRAGGRGAAARGDGPDRGRDRRAPALRRWSATTAPRARKSGSRTYIEMHVQFREGTTLERAHAAGHALRDAIEAELRDAEVLIHVEPEASARDPATEPKPYRAG